MTSRQIKLILAILVAGIGLFMVARLIVPSGASKPTHASAAVKPPSPELEAVLTGGYDTRPTTETVEADITRAVQRASVVIGSVRSASVPAARRADLSSAFGERLEAILNPDYMRDLRARSARGQGIEVVEPDEEVLERARTSGEFFALLPMDVQSVEVVPIFERGRYVGLGSAGFGTGTTRIGGKAAFPMADLDPVEDRLDIVEVRVPMEMPVPPPKAKKTERQIVGFQFVWNAERKQWAPWVIKTYGSGESGSYGLPF